MTSFEELSRMSHAPPTEDWEDCGSYWLNIHNQDSDKWKSARRNGWGVVKLLTASNFAKAADHATRFATAEEYLVEFKTGEGKEVTPEQQENMDRGKITEPFVRSVYDDKRREQNKSVTREVGLAVPKFDVRIGASVDGLVGKDGCIEIKCPRKIYPLLYDKSRPQINRIYRSHYDQMQGGMAICNRKWCDYVVFGTDEEKIFIERVPFNEKYWNEDLYPKLCQFLELAGVAIPEHLRFSPKKKRTSKK